MIDCPCDPAEQVIQELVASNGHKHRKRVCLKCGKGKLVRKDPSIKKINRASKALKEKYGESFYTSPEWLRVRYTTLANFNRVCALCGSKEKPLHVDHIKPRSKHPELELEHSNLQILCWRCNKGKGNRDDQDFREAVVVPPHQVRKTS